VQEHKDYQDWGLQGLRGLRQGLDGMICKFDEDWPDEYWPDEDDEGLGE
jgi:hypothetical protein